MAISVQNLGGFGLVLLLLSAILIIGAKFDLGPYFFNLQQTFSGTYGDLFGIGLFVAMTLALFGRHFNLMFEMQRFVREYALSPLFLTIASFMLTGFSNTSTIDIHHQHLILLIFLFAMYQRFSGTNEDVDLTKTKRIFSRFVEIGLYMQFPRYNKIWVWHYMLPSALIVCICRGNEVFRIWQNKIDNTSSDHMLAKKGFVKFYAHVIKKVFDSVDPIPWPDTTTSATSHHCPNERLEDIKEYLKESGMYGNFKPSKQYGFFWVKGSGLLVLSTHIVATLIFASSLKAQGTSLKWKLLLCAVSGGNLLYLIVQCLPGLIVFLENAHELTTIPLINEPLQRTPGRIVDRWREEMKDPWFIDIKCFASTLLENGLPLDQQPIPFIPWKFNTKKIEGFELILYVVIYGSSQALARICLIFLAFLIQKTRLNVPATNTFEFIVPNLAWGVAKLTALDVTRAKRAIFEAETTLHTRKKCTCSSDIKCIVSIGMGSLLETLEDEFNLDVGTQKDLMMKAITVGMLQSTQEKINEVGTKTKIYKISSRLHPVLGLLKQIYIDGHEYNGEHVGIVRVKLDTFFNGKWDDYKANKNDDDNYKCMEEDDWKLMRIQLQVSMLLFYFHDPNTFPDVVTGDILSEWLEGRKRIVGTNECDCIRYFSYASPSTLMMTGPPSASATPSLFSSYIEVKELEKEDPKAETEAREEVGNEDLDT